MINIKFNDKVYSIKNTTTELTIGEFEDLCMILNDMTLNKMERWSKAFNYLGVPEEVIDEFDSFEFIEIIKQFNIFNEELDTEFIKEIEVEGRIYSSFDEKFKLTVKENSLIEQAVAKHSEKYLGEMMAVIFKMEGTDKTIWYDAAHIKHKAKLFREKVTADKVIPFINYLTKKLVNEVNMIENDTTI